MEGIQRKRGPVSALKRDRPGLCPGQARVALGRLVYRVWTLLFQVPDGGMREKAGWWDVREAVWACAEAGGSERLWDRAGVVAAFGKRRRKEGQSSKGDPSVPKVTGTSDREKQVGEAEARLGC